jgi:glycosyltransferase involved in cell wall biosynthesis
MPCRNEAMHIGECLESILANDYPRDRFEVIVVDGMSSDGTTQIVARLAERHGVIRLLRNPRQITPAALNIGIRDAAGDIIMRMDAHATYPAHYVSRLVEWLLRSGADNVGGRCLTVPSGPGARAEAIAIGLSHPFGVGNAYFRIGVRKPRWVDTVPFGCYRREVFDRVGLFDEQLSRNQDDEFNLRLKKFGGRILLVPDVELRYGARDSLAKLWRMFYQYGYFKPLVALKTGGVFTTRQLAPPLFVIGMLTLVVLSPFSRVSRTAAVVVAAAYVVSSVATTARARVSHHAARAWLPVVFLTLHASYGIGYARAVVELLLLDRLFRGSAAALPLSR